MKLDEVMDAVTEQIYFEHQRGWVETIDIDYIEETAEKVLTPEDFQIFAENRAAVAIYQDMIL